MTISMAEIGETIRQRRCELGLTQEKLAERIGVTSQQIQRYEYGKTRLKVDNLQALARALDVQPEFFFGQPEGTSDPGKILRMGPAERTLVERFRRIRNDQVRNLVVILLKIAAEGEGASP